MCDISITREQHTQNKMQTLDTERVWSVYTARAPPRPERICLMHRRGFTCADNNAVSFTPTRCCTPIATHKYLDLSCSHDHIIIINWRKLLLNHEFEER